MGNSVRASVTALISPHPLGEFLPAMYHEDTFAQSLTAGLDAVLAPIFSSLDNLEAYLDPALAPEDFLDWLGGWVGLVVDETWPLDRRRVFISRAHELYRMRGTAKGLTAHVELFSGGQVEVEEPGGTSWSATTGGALPGSAGFNILVRVRVDDPATVDQARLNALVAAAKPAHLTHRVEVVGKTPPAAAAPRAPRPRPAAPPASAPGPESSSVPTGAPPPAPEAGPALGAPAEPVEPPTSAAEPPAEGTA
ncbi:MAG: phage tail protein [Candidatus Dormiibacterota bacterium]